MRRILALAACVVGLAGWARADTWDVGGHDDNSSATRNELVHGADQRHDLGVLDGPAPDEDWFVVLQQPHASYEALLDSASADFGPAGPSFERYDGDGTTLLQSSVAAGGVGSRSLSWANTADNPAVGFLRVRSLGCSVDCLPADVYRIRLRETTGSIARFNNAAGQVSLVVLQNTGSASLDAQLSFWSSGGALLSSLPVTLAPHATTAVNTSALPGLAGASGGVRVAHDGPYGSLAGKAVAVEPATGFTFDTPLTTRGPDTRRTLDGTTSYCNSSSGCPGAGQPTANASCTDGACGFSCKGENYDVDGAPGNGCEVPDSPQGNHSQGTATLLGTFACEDSNLISFSGILPSDARVHELPAVPSFDPVTGSAPDWQRLVAAGGAVCVNDLSLTFQVAASAFPTCYRMTVTTDVVAASCSASPAGACSLGPLAYSDGTDVFITLDKTCDTTAVEAASYTVSGHP
jgi:hypothetical protein